MPKSSQEKTTATPKYPGLVERILDVFGTDSQKEVADKLGITEPSISEWKKTGKISVENLLEISILTGASITWILIEEEPKFLKDAATSSEMVDIETIKRNAIREFLVDTLVNLPKASQAKKSREKLESK